MLNWIIWNWAVYMYKKDLALNNLQWLIGHETKPNQTNLRKLDPTRWQFLRINFKFEFKVVLLLDLYSH